MKKKLFKFIVFYLYHIIKRFVGVSLFVFVFINLFQFIFSYKVVDNIWNFIFFRFEYNLLYSFLIGNFILMVVYTKKFSYGKIQRFSKLIFALISTGIMFLKIVLYNKGLIYYSDFYIIILFYLWFVVLQLDFKNFY